MNGLDRFDLVVVGSGALARAMTQAASSRLAAILARNAESAADLAVQRGVPAWPWGAPPRGSRPVLWLLAVADRANTEVAEHLSTWARPGDVALSTSGALELDVLEPLARAGIDVGRFHPLAPFPRAKVGDEPDFEGVAVAVSGSPRAREAARDLARSVGASPFDLEPGRAAAHHRSAAWLANGLVGLFARVEATAGSSSPELRRGWIELLRRTLDALERAPAAEALTGPVARGEAAVVAAHLAGLPPGADRALFLELARAQLELVREQLPAERAAALEALLAGDEA